MKNVLKVTVRTDFVLIKKIRLEEEIKIYLENLSLSISQ